MFTYNSYDTNAVFFIIDVYNLPSVGCLRDLLNFLPMLRPVKFSDFQVYYPFDTDWFVVHCRSELL